MRAGTERDYEHTDCDRCRRKSAPPAFAPEQTKGDSGSGQRKGHSEKQERQRRDCEEAVRHGLRCHATKVVPSCSPDHDAEEKRGQQERKGHADQKGGWIVESRIVAWFVLRPDQVVDRHRADSKSGDGNANATFPRHPTHRDLVSNDPSVFLQARAARSISSSAPLQDCGQALVEDVRRL
jgi:hypothetical protein